MRISNGVLKVDFLITASASDAIFLHLQWSIERSVVTCRHFRLLSWHLQWSIERDADVYAERPRPTHRCISNGVLKVHLLLTALVTTLMRISNGVLKDPHINEGGFFQLNFSHLQWSIERLSQYNPPHDVLNLSISNGVLKGLHRGHDDKGCRCQIVHLQWSIESASL